MNAAAWREEVQFMNKRERRERRAAVVAIMRALLHVGAAARAEADRAVRRLVDGPPRRRKVRRQRAALQGWLAAKGRPPAEVMREAIAARPDPPPPVIAPERVPLETEFRDAWADPAFRRLPGADLAARVIAAGGKPPDRMLERVLAIWRAA